MKMFFKYTVFDLRHSLKGLINRWHQDATVVNTENRSGFYKHRLCGNSMLPADLFHLNVGKNPSDKNAI